MFVDRARDVLGVPNEMIYMCLGRSYPIQQGGNSAPDRACCYHCDTRQDTDGLSSIVCGLKLSWIEEKAVHHFHFCQQGKTVYIIMVTQKARGGNVVFKNVGSDTIRRFAISSSHTQEQIVKRPELRASLQHASWVDSLYHQ